MAYSCATTKSHGALYATTTTTKQEDKIMSLKSRVLTSFRKLHRARLQVFEGDSHALNAGREKINSDYKNNKALSDSAKIEKLVEIAEDAERLLRTTVVQGKLTEDNKYELKITPDTNLEDNTIFKHDVILPLPRKKKCSDKKD